MAVLGKTAQSSPSHCGISGSAESSIGARISEIVLIDTPDRSSYTPIKKEVLVKDVSGRMTSKKQLPFSVFILIFSLFLFLIVEPLSVSGDSNSHAGDASGKSSLSEKTAITDKIKSLIGPRDAVFLADASGKPILAVNENKLLIPASTLKMLTSLAALHYLGEDFRFKTELYMDNQENLKIKGHGDPLLISEVLREIARELSTRVSGFNDLILDTSHFTEPLIVPGVTSSFQPYDAPNGALCVNFNTVYFKQDKTGKFISAESETPLLPFVLPKIKKSKLREGRILLAGEKEECFMYAGHLFLYFFSSHNILSSGKIRMGEVDTSKDEHIYTYISGYPLAHVIRRLLEFSNNYIANQLMLAMSAIVQSPPGTMEKGVRVLNEFAKKELKIEDIRISEGSGISRNNRITAKEMMKILNKFAPYYDLLRKDGNVYYKTGTLNGIRTRAGYIRDLKGNLLPFVILINTPNKSDKTVLNNLTCYVQS